MKTARIWTPAIRAALYETLVHRFGAHAEWKFRHYPSEERRAEYETFLSDYAKAIGASDGGPAVQIIWAVEDREPVMDLACSWST